MHCMLTTKVVLIMFSNKCVFFHSRWWSSFLYYTLVFWLIWVDICWSADAWIIHETCFAKEPKCRAQKSIWRSVMHSFFQILVYTNENCLLCCTWYMLLQVGFYSQLVSSMFIFCFCFCLQDCTSIWRDSQMMWKDQMKWFASLYFSHLLIYWDLTGSHHIFCKDVQV